jgi:hypothetical protein
MTIRHLSLVRSLIVAATVVAAATAGGALWLVDRDPISSLPPPEHDLKAERDSVTMREGRKVEHFILRTSELGDIGVVVSLPEPLPRYGLPIVLVLGGFGTGEETISSLPDPGDNALVGYDWPMPVRLDSWTILTGMPRLYRRVMTIPGQVSSALDWLEGQPWADRRSVSLVGFSLGAVAAPAIEDVAQHDGQKIGWTILAYGGDPLGALVAANPYTRPRFLRPVLAPLIDILLSPLEPERHLPRLSSEFLVLEGSDDALIPEAARARFRDAVPEPKTVRTFDGDHTGVGPDTPAPLSRIIDAGKVWLIDKGAIAPF